MEWLMADNLEDRGPQDRSRINLEQEHEVHYWTKLSGVLLAGDQEALLVTNG
jgi:hypothetical protein